MTWPPPLFAVLWPLPAAGLLLIAATLAAWLLVRYRAHRREVRREFAPERAELRRSVRAALRRRRPRHVKLSTGAWVHIVPAETASREPMERAIAIARRDTGTDDLVQIGMEDLLASDHPATSAFYGIAEVDPKDLAPEMVRFTIAPSIVSQKLLAAMASEGLSLVKVPKARARSPSTDEGDASPQTGSREGRPTSKAHGGGNEPRGGYALAASAYGHQLDLGLAALMAEAAVTATPIETMARDEALRLEAELSMLAGFTEDAREALGRDTVELSGGRLLLSKSGEDTAFDLRDMVLSNPTKASAETRLLSEIEGGAPAHPDEGAWEAPIVIRRLSGISEAAESDIVRVDKGGWVETFHLFSSRGVPEPIRADHPLAKSLGIDRLACAADDAISSNTFTGRYFSVAAGPSGTRAWVLVGPHVASIAQHPSLLTGASEAIGGPPPNARARIYSHRDDVLIIANVGAEGSLIATCRRRAALFIDGTRRREGSPLLLDVNMNLHHRGTGTFDLSKVDARFFDAAEGALQARLSGNLGGAATARAMMRLSLDDIRGARAHLEAAVRASPDDGEILLALGTLLNEMGDHEAAEEILRRAVGLDVENPATNNNLGVAYQGLGRLAEAQLFFEKAATIKPKDPITRVNLGRAKLDSGEPLAAEHSFLDALARDPLCVPALTGLILVAIREGDYDLARDRLGTALRVAPTDDGLLRLHQALYPNEQAH